MDTRHQSLRLGKGSRCKGVVSGYVFKIIRESVRLTQCELAERLDMDTTTVQAWETGRRSLTALRVGDLTRLRMTLTRLGAPPGLFDMLTDAMEADLVIGDAVAAGAKIIASDLHPLAASVHRRALTSLITWPFTGSAPLQLREQTELTVSRRGPVARQPVISAEDRTRFFDHLLVTAEAHRGKDDALLRRQAIYLLGFDDRAESVNWLATEQRRAVRTVAHAEDVPSWVAVRSSAVALANNGNRDPLQAYVRRGLTNEAQDVANLNYWAYWVGEFPAIYADDTFMVSGRPQTWTGERLLPHLLNRLQPGAEQAELYIHTLWALLATHPGLLLHDPSLRAIAQIKIDEIFADPELTPHARQELASVAYTIRLGRR